METKKSNRANLEKKRGMFFQVGLLLALGLAFVAFEWQVALRVSDVKWEPVPIGDVDEFVIQATFDKTPPPPPEPPKVTDILDIVSNDVQVETHIDINMEAHIDTEIPIITASLTGTEVKEVDEILPFITVEEKPLFNGKDAEEAFRDWVYKNTIYPTAAQEIGISGRVFVSFTIDRTGQLVDIQVTRGVDPLLDDEALRVIKTSPKWTPGMQRGKPVKVTYTFPFLFKLNN